MLANVRAGLRLSRPVFLAGGFIAFALGALVARYAGHSLDLGLYAVGQFLVTSIQLMAQYLNEYWDVEADRLNTSRTSLTGGSGMVSGGIVPRETAMRAAKVCIVLVTAAVAVLVVQFRLGPLVWAVIAAGFFLAFFYSSPPLRLESTGLGELTASVEVAGLLPMFSYLLFAGRLDSLILLVIAPLAAFHYAMLIVFDMPDTPSDLAGGKKTLLVRIGRDRGMEMHNALIVTGFAVAAAASLGGLPIDAAWSLVPIVPLAAYQVFEVNRARSGGDVQFQRLTIGAAALFAAATIVMAVSFWALG